MQLSYPLRSLHQRWPQNEYLARILVIPLTQLEILPQNPNILIPTPRNIDDHDL